MKALASFLALCAAAASGGCGESPADPAPDAMLAPDGGAPVVPDAATAPDAAPDAMVPSNIRFVALADGAIVAGVEHTEVESFDLRGVVRMELFIDTGRLGDDTVVPFAIDWTSTDFSDGPHELRARAHFGDGTSSDAVITVRIDNTAPVIRVPATIETDELEVTVTDYTGVASIVIDGHTLTAPPYRIPWNRLCGTDSLYVTATDLAGNVNYSTRYNQIETINPRDRDCDQWESPTVGGTDCLDSDASVNPGATDPGVDARDLNCDGMPGVDGDGDHVATRATGGDDCDDGRRDVHGAQLRWRDIAVRRGDGAEIYVPHEEFVRAAIGGAEVHLLDWTEGVTVHRGFGLDGTERVVHPLPEVGSRRWFLVSQGQLVIAYVDADEEIRAARWSGGAWSNELVAAAVPGGVRDLVLDAHGSRLHLGYLADGVLRVAERGVTGWTRRDLVTDSRLTRIGRVDAERSAVIAYGPRLVVRARYATQPAQVQSLPITDDGEVTHATTIRDVLLYQRDYPRTGYYDAAGNRVSSLVGYYRTYRMPFFGEVLAGNGGGGFAILDPAVTDQQLRRHGVNGRSLDWPGHSDGDDIIFRSGSALAIPDAPVLPAADATGDGVDSDCDGTDG